MTKKVEDILKAMRGGYSASHLIKYGDFEFNVRVLTAEEERMIYEGVRSMYQGDDENASSDLVNAEIMRRMLGAAATIDGVSGLPAGLLKMLTSAELEALYGKYMNVLHEVDPEFQEMDMEKVAELIDGVKKNKLKPRKVSSMHLAMIGVFFLEQILPRANEHGS